MNEIPLKDQSCKYIQKGSKPLIIPTIEGKIREIEGWDAALSYQNINKIFKFKNYHQTIAFVNAVTWISHKEDHHPNICFDYNECKITLTTHAAKGITQNDFILAAKINHLLD